MPHEENMITIEGEITDVFAHRIVLKTASGSLLADLGPKGAKLAEPKTGDKVKLSGEQKPSELKVATFEKGGEVIEIPTEEDHDAGHEHADPAVAKASVEKLDHTVTAEPNRKPKHFEILGRDAEGRHHEHHVELDGTIGKTKDGDRSHEKWNPQPRKTA